jgi:hypothetical protein
MSWSAGPACTATTGENGSFRCPVVRNQMGRIRSITNLHIIADYIP